MVRISKFPATGLGKSGHCYSFWCPGCEMHHTYWADRTESPNWQFNGDKINPTFTPSLHVTHAFVCHLFVTNGKIQYCADSQHKLAGQIIDLPEDPDPWPGPLETF